MDRPFYQDMQRRSEETLLENFVKAINFIKGDLQDAIKR